MLSEIFDLKRIKLDLESTTRDDVFQELVGTIVGNDSELNPRDLLAAVSLREGKMNTHIVPGIAVPHGYCRTVDGIIGAIGFSKAGIRYYSDDRGDPVHLFFMILMDESSREQHLQVSSHLWDLINNEAFSHIQKQGNPQELYSFISQY